jgi:hypothetical protein
MIFSINQTFQRILASIAQGGSDWSSTPPKFALDQKSPLSALQRPPMGGTDPVGNHGYRQCWILNISHPIDNSRPVTGIALLFLLLYRYEFVSCTSIVHEKPLECSTHT